MTSLKYKTYAKCNKSKSINDFHKNKSRKDGLQHYCKIYLSEKIKSWRVNNKQKYNQTLQDWHKINPATYIFNNKKRQCKTCHHRNAQYICCH